MVRRAVCLSACARRSAKRVAASHYHNLLVGCCVTLHRRSALSHIAVAMASDSESDSTFLQSLFDEAEEEEEDKQQLLSVILSSVPLLFDKREQSYSRCHLDCSTHVSELNCEGPNAFYKLYRMHYHSYMKLCSLLDDSVKKNSDMADVRSGNAPGSQLGVITTEIALHCCIRWLSGGSYQDIRLLACVSETSFYVYAHRCVITINNCSALAYKFPITPQEIKFAATGFSIH